MYRKTLTIRNTFLVVAFLCSLPLFSQTPKSYFVDAKSNDVNQLFDDLVEGFFESNYFIQQVDKDALFIQVKYIDRKKGLFSKDLRFVYNLILRSGDSSGTRIHVSANLEERDWSGSSSNNVYYYTDTGKTTNPKYYEQIIQYLKEETQ